MIPYYEKDNITIYHGNCLKIMKQFEDKSFDLVLTDPPYGTTNAEWDKIPAKDYFDEIFRVSEKQIIFGGHWFNLPKKDGWIIWNKMPFLKTTNQCELIWTSFLKKNEIIDFRYAGNVVGNKKPDYKRKRVVFTSQKPVEFIEILIKEYTNISDIILDPFMGSGTTLIAAKQLKRKAVGIEIIKEYCEIAKQRLEATPVLLF